MAVNNINDGKQKNNSKKDAGTSINNNHSELKNKSEKNASKRRKPASKQKSAGFSIKKREPFIKLKSISLSELMTPGWRLGIVFFVFPIIFLGVIIAAMTYLYFAQDLPSLEALKNYKPPTVTFVYSDDGAVIGEYYHEHRLVTPLSDIPKHVINAFLAAEDANFYHHPGLDILGIARAFAKNMRAGKIVQGGSTITQQITRSFLLSNEKTYERKIREILLAHRIEQNLSKDEILFLYLNQIYLGNGAYGVESAAQLYYDKHVSDLSVGEAALIAGLVSAPSKYSPFKSAKIARERQVYVIDQMVESGFIKLDQAVDALDEKIEFKTRPNINLEATPYFTEHVRRIAEELLGQDVLYNEGLKIYTTVNIESQLTAREAVRKGLRDLGQRQGYSRIRMHLEKNKWNHFLNEQTIRGENEKLKEGYEVEGLITKVTPKNYRLDISVGGKKGYTDYKGTAWTLRGRTLDQKYKEGDVILVTVTKHDENADEFIFSVSPDPDAEAAFICMDNETGDVKAMIGGRDFRESQFNRAVQAKRQPGSSFKPFVYTAAMDSGWTPASVVVDYPVVYEDQGRMWSPKNYGRGHSGPITLFSALSNSVNVVAVRLLEKVGAQRVIEYAHKMGIESELGPNLSLALGTSEVTLVEMVRGFSNFPNLGEYVEPRYITKIEDRDGNVLMTFPTKKVRSISPETAYIVLDMLKGVVFQGTARRVSALGRPIGGKTGTTQDHADAWFIGFTPGYTAGAWVGRDVRKKLGYGEQGGRTAAPIFVSFMEDFLKDKPIRDFVVPPGVIRTTIGTHRFKANGEIYETKLYMSFKKNEVGRGMFSETGIPGGEHSGASKVNAKAKQDIDDRMKRRAKRYKSNIASKEN